MPDRFLYKTVRAEYWVNQISPIGNMVRHGPYASERDAEIYIEILKARALQLHKYQIQYLETDVDIDPILQQTVDDIALNLTSKWFDNIMTSQLAKKNVVYIPLTKVRKSLEVMADLVRKSYTTGLENPDADKASK